MVSKEKTERMVQTNRQHVRSSARLNIRLDSIAPIRDFNYVQHAQVYRRIERVGLWEIPAAKYEMSYGVVE